MPELSDARAALRLREQSKTFKEIGEELGVSGGKAHHFVKEGLADCGERAELFPRPPTRQPMNPELGAVLIARLRGDLEGALDLAADHVEAEELRQPVKRSEEALDKLEEMLIPGRPKRGLTKALKDLVAGFDALLESATSCPMFARVGAATSAETFRSDTLQLGKKLAPRMKIDLPPWTKPKVERSGPALPPLKSSAAGERLARNQEIIKAYCANQHISKIAESFGLTTRQVERIISEWKETQPELSRAAIENGRDAVQQLTRSLRRRKLSAGGTLAEVDQELRIIDRAANLLGGLGSPDPQRGSAVDPDLLTNLNRGVRRLLSEKQIDEDLIEAVTFYIVETLEPREELASAR